MPPAAETDAGPETVRPELAVLVIDALPVKDAGVRVRVTVPSPPSTTLSEPGPARVNLSMVTLTVALRVTVPKVPSTVKEAGPAAAVARAVTENVTVPSPVTLPPPLTVSFVLSTPLAVTLIAAGVPEVCLTGILTGPLAPANSVMLAPPIVNSGGDWMVTETVALCVTPARLPTTTKLAEPAAAFAGAVTLKVTDPEPVTEPPPLTAMGPVIVLADTEIGSGTPTVWLACMLT